MAGREDWMLLAEGAGIDDVRERILTGFKDGKPFTPYVPTVPLPANLESVLDFGCGLGRNFPYLARIARTVAGFDLPPMVQRCRQEANQSIDLLSSDWEQVRRLRFDAVFASLVLQHIEPQPVRAFLRDFSCITPAVYLLTRTDTDFGEKMLDVVVETELFAAGECVEVEHDPVTHQLNVVRRMPFSEAREAGPDRHFEMVLTARR